MKRLQIPTIGKRILSALIDLAIISGLTCLFYFCVFSKVVSIVQDYKSTNEHIDLEKMKSKLYVYKDGRTISILENNSKAGEKEIAEPLKDFYVNYYKVKDETDMSYWYYTHVLYLDEYKEKKYGDITKPEVILLKWNDDKTGYVHKEGTSQTDIDEFFRISCSTALTRLSNMDPIKGYIHKITFGNIRAVLYASMVGSVIPCLLIPVLLKNGKTIGKLATGLIVLTDEGYYYKKYKLIFRYLAFYFIEFFGGVITIGLTFILSSSLVLFSKKKRALHDYIAFSVVLDEKQSVFFLDANEEEQYKLKQDMIANQKQ